MPDRDADRSYAVFMARTIRLHERVQRRLAARFPEPPEGGGPATFLRFTPIHALPLEADLGADAPPAVPDDAVDWPTDDDLRLWTWGGLHAALVEIACEAGFTGLAPVYGVERETYLRLAAAKAASSPDGAERVREAVRTLPLPGERAYGDAYVREAYAALDGRFGKVTAAMLLRRLRVLPGLEKDFWPLAEPHLARWRKPLKIGPVKLLALRGALKVAAFLSKAPPSGGEEAS